MADSVSPAKQAPDEKRQVEARRYSSLKRSLYFLELGFSAVFLAIVAFTGLSRYISSLFANLPPVVKVVAYFILLMLAYAIVTAPLSYYSNYILPRRYGLSRQNMYEWFADALKGGVISLVLGSGILAAVYWLMDNSPTWWLWAWLVAMVVSLILSILAPIVILPMFFKTKLIPPGELRTRLEELASKAGLKLKGIYSVEFSTKTSTANAALMGVGRTRRIILSDTLTDTYSIDEILMVMGHEMGHQRHGDTLRLFAFQGSILLGTFYVTDILMRWLTGVLGYAAIADANALPLFVLIVGALGIITGPVLAAFSRYLESQADLYSLELTGNTRAFISAMSKLTDQNLSEANPPRWVEILMDDHPSYRQRVDMARHFRTA
jgi:STE24 endopeptidase